MLAPLGSLTAAATARRVARPPACRPGIPVICVGNLTAGGAGKTPTAIALVQTLAERGIAAHVVSRGYGGRLVGPVSVDERRHRAEEVGDEPLLLAAFAPTWIARNRAEGARAAEAAGAQALILDDGFQNPALAKDLSIVVVDAETGFGNGRCLPAGPLRERVAAGLKRAHLVLSIGHAAAQARFDDAWGAAIQVPQARAALEPLRTGMDWDGLPTLAFAGIARPEKFFDTLRDLGADLRGTVALEDHQPLTPALLRRLMQDAAQQGAQLVTTEKDAVRLPAALRRAVLTLPVRLSMTDGAALDAALDRLFAAKT
jgi:tetraacyldisaccharide 4'-kinase